MRKVLIIVVLVILAILVGPKVFRYLSKSGEGIGTAVGHELYKNMNNN